MCTLFEEGSEKVYVLYTQLNVDNYGRPLTLMTMTMIMKNIYSTIDIQIEKAMYISLENQIINWSGDYY